MKCFPLFLYFLHNYKIYGKLILRHNSILSFKYGFVFLSIFSVKMHTLFLHSRV